MYLGMQEKSPAIGDSESDPKVVEAHLD